MYREYTYVSWKSVQMRYRKAVTCELLIDKHDYVFIMLKFKCRVKLYDKYSR